MTRLINFLTGLALGMLVGGGIAVLFAPQPGHEIRSGISERWKDVGSQYRQVYGEQRERLQQRFIELKNTR